MTDEELQQTIQDLGKDVDKLSSSDNPLTKEESRRRQILLLKRETLQRIKEAREKNDKNQELYNTMAYSLLTSFGEKHPFLLHFMESKFRMNLL